MAKRKVDKVRSARAKLARLKARIHRTLRNANDIDGRGLVLGITWGVHYAGVDRTDTGLVVRQHPYYGMDAVSFRMVGSSVKFLGKLRVVVP